MLGIISFPVAPLRYLLKRIPATKYTTSKEIKIMIKMLPILNPDFTGQAYLE